MGLCCPLHGHPNDPVCSRIMLFGTFPPCEGEPPPGDEDAERVRRLYHAYAKEFPQDPDAQVDLRLLISLADMLALYGYNAEALAVLQKIESDPRLLKRVSWQSRVSQSKCDVYRSQGDFKKARAALYEELGEIFQLIPTLEDGTEALQPK